MPTARLADRAVLLVDGADAQPFLQNLVTADLDALEPGEARPSALLTPQGKILFDFLVSRTDNGFRLDVAAAARTDLLKRLTLYRLRAKVAFTASEEPVAASWGENGARGHLDRRFPDGTVRRLYGEPVEAAKGAADEFRALRIESGVAEAEADFPASDVFPHDVLLDQNGGVSFRKGCFVGQEVVSRMQHRGTARRRLMVIRADEHLTPGANIDAGDKTVGTLLSTAGSIGLGLVRIDRLAEALDAGSPLSVDGVPVDAEIPPFAGYALPRASESEVEE